MIPFLVVLLALLVTVVELVRRRRLREEFSWLWIGACALCIVALVVPQVRSWMAGLLPGVESTQLALALVSLFLVALCLHFSIQVSAQSNRIKNLAQEVALLRKALAELRGNDEPR
jgi:hypothetical protein